MHSVMIVKSYCQSTVSVTWSWDDWNWNTHGNLLLVCYRSSTAGCPQTVQILIMMVVIGVTNTGGCDGGAPAAYYLIIWSQSQLQSQCRLARQSPMAERRWAAVLTVRVWIAIESYEVELYLRVFTFIKCIVIVLGPCGHCLISLLMMGRFVYQGALPSLTLVCK